MIGICFVMMGARMVETAVTNGRSSSHHGSEIVEQDAERLAMMLWAVAHGIVSLELAGYLPSEIAGRPMYEQTIMNLLHSQKVTNHPAS